MSNDNYILAEFKGTYRAPHPEGIRDANVTKPFHVKVKMKRESLKAPGLRGLFATYYKDFLKRLYPDMIDTYEFDLVEATELDGGKIRDPKALSYDGLLEYIQKNKLPVNAMLYPRHELRNEVVLYEKDPEGQQHLQARLQKLKGNALETAAELQSLDDVMILVPSEPEPVLAKAKGKAKDPAEAFS